MECDVGIRYRHHFALVMYQLTFDIANVGNRGQHTARAPPSDS